ncbi:MAG: lipoate--protein ligase family protein [bacterium]|nr:lipoate--protein ligase family protein [bacterium]
MEGRLIFDESRPGALNMAIDEMLLSSCAQTDGAVLRFYSWSEPTLSLGYFQGVAEREGHSPSSDCSLVRRSSGGGAILHHHEITYSLATAGDSVRAQPLYDIVHDALVEVLQEKGIIAEKCKTPIQRSDEPFLCFKRRSLGDVIGKDHKIAGSAQRKQKGAILQHGSLLIQRSPFAPELPGINDIFDTTIDHEELRTSWAETILQKGDIAAFRSELSAQELDLARQIESGKFGCSKWTQKR